MWKMLSDLGKRQALKIIVSEKGVIPYEKANSSSSFSLKPENGFFFKKR